MIGCFTGFFNRTALLRAEGVEVSEDGRVDRKKFYHEPHKPTRTGEEYITAKAHKAKKGN
jgi:hypothetical protein